MGKNPSGIEPTEFNCVVKADKPPEKTQGGIFVPQQVLERDELASIDATLMAVSPLAFTYETWPDADMKPKPGDRVVIAKYAGSVVKGADDEDYRIIKDKDILAIRSK